MSTETNPVAGHLDREQPDYKHVPPQTQRTQPDRMDEPAPPADAPMTGSLILADVAAGFPAEFIAEQLARPVPKPVRRRSTPGDLDDEPDPPHLPLQAAPVTIGGTTVDLSDRCAMSDASIDDQVARIQESLRHQDSPPEVGPADLPTFSAPMASILTGVTTTPGATRIRAIEDVPAPVLNPAPAASSWWRRVRAVIWPPVRGAA